VTRTAYELTRCPVCDGAETNEIASPDDVTREVEQLWEFHTRRLRGGTPPEHLTDRAAFSQRPPLRVVQCTMCGLVYRNPRERAFELADAYSGEAPAPNVLRALHDTQREAYEGPASRLERALGRTGNGIELASYVGAFLAVARDRGWQFEGLDINEDVNGFTRTLGFRVTTGAIDSTDIDRTFDAVAIWNVFDQLPDPRIAARKAYGLLAPGGVVAIRVPNGEVYARLRAMLDGPFAAPARAMLAHNNLLSFPYRHGFTVSSLSRLLTDVGFEIVDVHGDALVPLADRWTRRWAAVEERTVKAVLRLVGASKPEMAPWFEIYARRG
jgi:SAM-dependent methyltransferase